MSLIYHLNWEIRQLLQSNLKHETRYKGDNTNKQNFIDVLHFREGWATCPSGHFIRGLHRGGGHQLNSIQWATCCKPALHPHWYKECYDQNVQGNVMECTRNNFYVVGIHRGSSHALSSINQLRCCNMYTGRWFSVT